MSDAGGMTAAGAATRRPPLPLVLAAVVVVALALLPVAYLVVRASAGGRAVEILAERETWLLVVRTLALAAGVVAAATVVAVPTAWLVTRTDLAGRRFIGVLAGVPLAIPSYVAALCLLGMTGPRGLIADVAGVAPPQLSGYWGALLALTLSTYPYVYLLTAAALRGVDPALEEAARAAGAGRLTVLARVTFPVARPAIGLGGLLAALYVLSDFGVVSLMRYDTLTRAMYLQYRSLFDRTPAAVLGLVLVALAAVLVVAERRTRSRGRLARGGPGSARVARRVALGRWQPVAVAWCAAVVGVFVVAPLAALGIWLGRAIENDRALVVPFSEAIDSITASGLAAVVAVAAALPVAILALRYPSRASRGLESAAYLANALPGIAIALALVFFTARYLPSVYQTLALLVFAYAVRFLPQALSGAESALQRVDPRLEEASRGLGRGRLATLAAVTLPLARPGLLAGAALVFLSAMKELPATLLLRPIGFETLATEVWTLAQVGAYSRAALPALVLIALSLPVLALASAESRTSAAASG